MTGKTLILVAGAVGVGVLAWTKYRKAQLPTATEPTTAALLPNTPQEIVISPVSPSVTVLTGRPTAAAMLPAYNTSKCSEGKKCR